VQRFDLSPTEWTQIVPFHGRTDVDIRPVTGSCITSLLFPGEQAATTLMPTPIPADMWAFPRQEVMAGLAVYAKAIGGPATVTVAPVKAN
jgi:hypothetical protein